MWCVKHVLTHCSEQSGVYFVALGFTSVSKIQKGFYLISHGDLDTKSTSTQQCIIKHRARPSCLAVLVVVLDRLLYYKFRLYS